MEGFLVSLGFEVWKYFETRYTKLANGSSIDDEIKESENNGNARYDILSGISNLELVNVIIYKYTGDI